MRKSLAELKVFSKLFREVGHITEQNGTLSRCERCEKERERDRDRLSMVSFW